jgi:hypothetical protein
MLRVDDPDGIVVDACWVPAPDCASRLEASHHWVREPLAAWLGERWLSSRQFRYRVEGADPRSLVVHPVP